MPAVPLHTRTGREAGTLSREARAQSRRIGPECAYRFFEEEAHFVEAVTRGEEAFDRAEYLSHEQVGQRL
jgi:hypothetical protein